MTDRILRHGGNTFKLRYGHPHVPNKVWVYSVDSEYSDFETLLFVIDQNDLPDDFTAEQLDFIIRLMWSTQCEQHRKGYDAAKAEVRKALGI